MKRKILMSGMLFGIIGICLTGCTIKLDDDDIKIFDKVKIMTDEKSDENVIYNGRDNETTMSISTNNENVENVTYVDNSEDNILYDSRVQYSHIDLGNSFYYIIYGHDEYGNTIWTYETEKVLYEDGYVTQVLDDYNNMVYLIDNGKLICLDTDTGKINWKKSNYYFINANYYFSENDNLNIIFGDTLTHFLTLDKNGKMIININLDEYEKELNSIPWSNWYVSFENSDLTMIGSPEVENYRKWLVKINLYNFGVQVKEIKYQELKPNNIIEKTLLCEYGDTFDFYKDGTFEHFLNNGYIDKYTTLKYRGTWQIKDSRLILTETEEIVAEGGHYEQQFEEYEDGIHNYNVLVDFDEKIIPTYREIEYKAKYFPDYNEKEIVDLDGTLYEVLEPVG